MSEDLKTIKELADELKISKVTMFRFLRDNSFTETKMIKNKKVYNKETANQIKKAFKNSRNDSNSRNNSSSKNDSSSRNNSSSRNDSNSRTDSNSSNDSNSILYEQVKSQNKIISEQSQQISQMQNLLDQQQRLALQDKQLLQEYKAENDKLKSLNMSNEYPKDEPNQETPLKDLEFENKALKEELSEQKDRREEALKKLRAELTQPKKWYEFWR